MVEEGAYDEILSAEQTKVTNKSGCPTFAKLTWVFFDLNQRNYEMKSEIYILT